VDDTDYALGRTNAEYERLIEQAELMRPLTERTLRAARITAGMRVLDIGCGMGDVSFLDQRRAARGLDNISFREGDARSVDSEGLFDAAVGRFVLMYMKDPTAALRRIAQPLPRRDPCVPRVGGRNSAGICRSVGAQATTSRERRLNNADG
jgi:hypothetical protein